MFQSAASKDTAEGRALMTASTVAVELRRAAKLGRDDNQGLVQKAFVLEVRDQRGDGGVEFLNQAVLIENALVVDVPAGAVEEV